MDFAFEDEVTVLEGFYKGYSGVVIEHSKPKNNKDEVTYKIKFFNEKLKNVNEWFNESSLTKRKKNILNLLFSNR